MVPAMSDSQQARLLSSLESRPTACGTGPLRRLAGGAWQRAAPAPEVEAARASAESRPPRWRAPSRFPNVGPPERWAAQAGVGSHGFRWGLAFDVGFTPLWGAIISLQ